MARVAQETDASNERFLRSRLEQFKDARTVENQIWRSNAQLANQQRDDERKQRTNVLNRVAAYNQGVREENLKSIAAISETAGKIVEQVEKKHIEGVVGAEYAIGLSEAASFGLDPTQSSVFDATASVLSRAATEEGVANDRLAEVDIVQAEDQRRSSPILRGWQAYGRALGRLQAAKGSWATALDVWIHSNNPIIPDPENPGKLISPRDMARRGPAGTMAALSAGNAFLMKQFGLDGINPALAAKELGETVNGVTASIARNILTEDRAIDKQNQVEEITSRLGVAVRGVDIQNTAAVTDFFNTNVNLLAPLVGGRGEANELVVNQLLNLSVATNDIPLLGAIEVANISNADPSLGTIGDRYPELFDRATERFKRKEVETEQQRVEQVESILLKAEEDFRSDLAAAGADPEAIKKANQDFRQRLGDLARHGGSEKAREMLAREVSKPITSTDKMYGILVENFQKTGGLPSDEELSQLVDDGSLSNEEARDLSRRRGPNLGAEMVKDSFNDIRGIASDIFIKDIVQGAGLNSIAKLGDFGRQAVITLTDETALHLQSWINSKPEGSLTRAAVIAEARAYASKAVKDRNYQIVVQEQAPPSAAEALRLGGKKPEPIFVGPVGDPSLRIKPAGPNPRSASGFSRDLRGERPEVVNGFMTQRDIVARDEEIDASIEALKNGDPLPERISQISQSTGIPASEIVQRQAMLNRGIDVPVSSFPINQQADQVRAIVPSEASMLLHPNLPPQRRSRSVERIRAARNIQMEREANKAQRESLARYNAMGISDPQASVAASGQPDVQALRPLMDLLITGESRSSGMYDAVAGSRTGIQGLSRMTFAQARQAGGNNAIGAYQFIPPTMEAAMRVAGLKPTDVFSPENQDRLASAWIMNGQRPRLSAYIRGESNDLAGAVNDAAQEWAALKGMTGVGKYDSDGVNKATISSGRTAQAIQQARRSFLDSRNNSSFTITPTLKTLGGRILYSVEKDSNGKPIPGLCTTNVLKTLEVNGIPNPDATGMDAGNNPRGAAVQFVNQFGWQSLRVPGSRPITLKSPYGKAAVNQMTLQQYQQAVGRGQIPSGALVFQTQNNSWNGTSDRSRGFDIAIARSGGSQLFNGRYMPSSIYGSATTSVFVLVPNN
jgi:hypothetical protein